MSTQTEESNSEPSYRFGPFMFFPKRQLLSRAGEPVQIGTRVITILATLVERPGELCSKEELISRAWPKGTVKEDNLKVAIATLRKALGEHNSTDKYIATTSGRGYRFVAPVFPENSSGPSHQSASPGGTPGLIGRAHDLQALRLLVGKQRLTTLVGPGGIGKTTIARAVGTGFEADDPDHLWLVDLALLQDGKFVSNAIAATLGIFQDTDDLLVTIIAYLRERRVLLILDNCEHLISNVAPIAESILRSTETTRILATSREPLGIPSEHIFRLPPLEVPPKDAGVEEGGDDQFSAVQLFLERAHEASGLKISEADIPVVGDICRKLDGIPLAIELVASRTASFGIRELSLSLASQFRTTRQARRAGPMRHRTLGAMLDWSYQLLSQEEKLILQRLSIFSGQFTLEAAWVVAACDRIAIPDIIDGIASLVNKSLLAADTSTERVTYRLLETTRVYSALQREQSGEQHRISQLHADYLRDLLKRSEDTWNASPAEQRSGLSSLLADVRKALDWSFSTTGSASIAIDLTIAAIPFYLHLSLMEECRSNAERAIQAISPKARNFDREKMVLYTAMAGCSMYSRGPLPKTGAAWAEALKIAESVGDLEYQLRAIYGLAVYKIYSSDHEGALALAHKFNELAMASADPSTRLSADRLMSVPLHYLGDQEAAHRYIDSVLKRYVAPLRRSHTTRFHLETQGAGLTTLANVLWLRGFPDQAIRTARNTLEAAKSNGDALSLCNALAHAAIPIAFWSGETELAERYFDQLRNHLDRYPMAIWSTLAACLEGMLKIRQDDPSGVRKLQAGIEKLEESGFGLRRPIYLGYLSYGYASVQNIADARKNLRKAQQWADRREPWCIGTLLCIEGRISELFEDGPFEPPDDCYRNALSWSRRTNVLAVELMAATDLASLLQRTGQSEEAFSELNATYSKFGEGFKTKNLIAARKLLMEIQAKS